MNNSDSGQSKKKKSGPPVLEHLKRPFLENFIIHGTKFQAAKATNIARSTVEEWLRNDPQFAKEFADADAVVTEVLESAAMARAVNGSSHLILHNGQIVREPSTAKDKDGKPIPGNPLIKREYSDLLLMFMLKARDRDKYSDRMKHEFDTRIAQQISAEVVTALRKVVPEFCPGCKTHLGLPAKISEELKTLSAKLSIH